MFGSLSYALQSIIEEGIIVLSYAGVVDALFGFVINIFLWAGLILLWRADKKENPDKKSKWLRVIKAYIIFSLIIIIGTLAYPIFVRMAHTERKENNMGLFSKSDIRKGLEEIYIPMFQTMMGMSPSQAKSTFHQLLKEAEEESENEGTSNLPQNFGDTLLENESSDETIKSMLAKLRSEGVRDEDIRWWWNMHDLERRMMQKVDFMDRFALFLKLREENGLTQEEAAKRGGRHFPIFGDPDDATLSTGEDRPLPYELKDRINIYVEKRSQTDPKQFKREVEESSSFNALIRKEIAKGNI